MGKYSIKDINKFLITDDDAGLTYLGGNQEWYGKFFRRLAGCGPTAAANIFKYLGADKLPAGSVRETDTLRQYKTLMNEMWEHEPCKIVRIEVIENHHRQKQMKNDPVDRVDPVNIDKVDLSAYISNCHKHHKREYRLKCNFKYCHNIASIPQIRPHPTTSNKSGDANIQYTLHY